MFEELKRYVRLGDEDARRLVAIAPHVRPSFVRLAREFYDRIREHEGAHAIFTGEAQIERLQRSLVTWLERVFGGVYDAAYFAKTDRIGAVHVRVGLPQRFVVAAMAVLRTSLGPLIDAHAGTDAGPTRDALGRLLDVELAIMLDPHHQDVVGRVKRAGQIKVDPSAQSHLDAIDLAPVFVVGLDRSGTIFLFNRAAETATGWAVDEVLGRSFVDLFVPTDERRSIAPKLFVSGVLEAPLLTRSGKVLAIRWRIAGAPTARRPDGAVFAFGADVTAEKAESAQGNQRLRLAAAGALVAGLAHEIRNPLNGAGLHLAFIERALTKQGTGETLDAVRVVAGELARLAGLVTDFLEFARPKPLVLTAVLARAVCERAIQATADQAVAANVTVTTELANQEVTFEADGPRLEQVVGHLLENAIDALRPGGGTVVVRVRREPRHGWIEVEDDGPGLADPEAPIFDAFYSTKADGAGLGLAIVHRVATDHGGSVDADSRPGRTRFRLRLPLTREGQGS